MADTEYGALSPTNVTAATDGFVIVRGGVPYRFTGVFPVIDAAGTFASISVDELVWSNGANAGVAVSDRGDPSNVNKRWLWYSTSDILRMRRAGADLVTWDATGNYRPGSDNGQALGSGSLRWSVVYAGTGTINTSDEREKREIGAIPDAWLDAWGDVEWSRFKFKGGNRWHVGLVAQRVHAAFAERGLDAFEIGLCCFDKWDAQSEPVPGKGGKPTKRMRIVVPAGDRWGLRYDECFAIEAAWQRREMARLAERLAAIEAAA